MSTKIESEISSVLWNRMSSKIIIAFELVVSVNTLLYFAFIKLRVIGMYRYNNRQTGEGVDIVSEQKINGYLISP